MPESRAGAILYSAIEGNVRVMGKAVPKREKITSAFLLAVLIVFVSMIGLEGYFRPTKTNLSATSQPTAVGGYTVPTGWSINGAWETYPNGRMYEKIDGRETLFQQYGAVRLEFASVTGKQRDFDVYIYQMSDPDGALGIYLAQVPSDYEEIEIGATMADFSGGQVRAFQGKIYLEIQPMDKTTDSKLTRELARSFISQLRTEKAAARGIFSMLPKKNQVKGSLTLNTDNTYGLKSLGNTFSAGYEVNGQSFDLLIKKIDPQKDDQTIQKARDELKEFDGKVLTFQSDKLTAEILGNTLILVKEGNQIRGAYGSMPAGELESQISKLKDQADERK